VNIAPIDFAPDVTRLYFFSPLPLRKYTASDGAIYALGYSGLRFMPALSDPDSRLPWIAATECSLWTWIIFCYFPLAQDKSMHEVLRLICRVYCGWLRMLHS
jgi:hypothetical protein